MSKPYQLGLYEKAMPNSLNMADKLRTAKQFHYDFMELSIDETPEKLARLDMSRDDRLQLVQLMQQEALPIRTICLSGHRKYPLGSADPDLRRTSLAIMERAIHLACDLGVRIIQIAGYDVYYEPSTQATRDYFLIGLRKSVEMAAQYGVILAFETMETPFMNTVKKAMVYVSEINSPYLQVYPDAGNCTNAAIAEGQDVIQDLLVGTGHIAALHLKETVPGKYREIEFGHGHVDFEAMISNALAQGVRLFVTEFWDHPTMNYREHILFSKSFIDEKFSSADQNSGMLTHRCT